ncbi:hypothetical protein [Pseudomonas gingeri]|uniref:hypothetical protein n=1 Tax=Pseudomonas gingeri TaxID=117681 RepID=UPI00159FB597|nr:hypothetical protein [Pseudomonas gingeri]NWA05397.1 hypothetical protein [Pseudomonas gingeri]NWA17820.1 hypothetical protein [Pseudomonas gingeri]NWA57784.1 hypothetical protein [Pseudomonas gingeri]NWA98805.1 hypothetical protein [Pseudomonas gingeri]NWB05931.1 hypothetical protein [Pseudomonas gingeri]
MENIEKWAIKNADGQLLLSFAIDAAQIQIGWFLPDARVKSKEGKKGPLTFKVFSKAEALLASLLVLLPKEFTGAQVVNFE